MRFLADPPDQAGDDAEGSTIDVDVRPVQREQLALTNAGGERQPPQRLELVALCGREQLARLVRIQGLQFLALDARWVDQVRDVYQPPAKGLLEPAVKNNVDVADSLGRASRIEEVLVELLDALRLQSCEGDPAELRLQVIADDLGVAGKGSRAKRRLCSLEPRIEVGRDCFLRPAVQRSW